MVKVYFLLAFTFNDVIGLSRLISTHETIFFLLLWNLLQPCAASRCFFHKSQLIPHSNSVAFSFLNTYCLLSEYLLLFSVLFFLPLSFLYPLFLPFILYLQASSRRFNNLSILLLNVVSSLLQSLPVRLLKCYPLYLLPDWYLLGVSLKSLSLLKIVIDASRHLVFDIANLHVLAHTHNNIRTFFRHLCSFLT